MVRSRQWTRLYIQKHVPTRVRLTFILMQDVRPSQAHSKVPSPENQATKTVQSESYSEPQPAEEHSAQKREPSIAGAIRLKETRSPASISAKTQRLAREKSAMLYAYLNAVTTGSSPCPTACVRSTAWTSALAAVVSLDQLQLCIRLWFAHRRSINVWTAGESHLTYARCDLRYRAILVDRGCVQVSSWSRMNDFSSSGDCRGFGRKRCERVGKHSCWERVEVLSVYAILYFILCVYIIVWL
jgi:hypothetical protein